MKPHDYLFGEIAIRLRLLTREQLASCLNYQAATRSDKQLGEICLEKGYLEQRQVTYILEQQRRLTVKAQSKQPARAAPGAPNRTPPKKRRSRASIDRIPQASTKSRTPTLDQILAVYMDDNEPTSQDRDPVKVPPVIREKGLSARKGAIRSFGSSPSEAPGSSLHRHQRQPGYQPLSRSEVLNKPQGHPNQQPSSPLQQMSDQRGQPNSYRPHPAEMARQLQQEKQKREPQSLRGGADQERLRGERVRQVAVQTEGRSCERGSRGDGMSQNLAAPGREQPGAPPHQEQPQRGSEPSAPSSMPYPNGSVDGLLANTLRRAVEIGASDLHLHSGSPLLVRVNGKLRPFDDRQIDAESAGRAIADLVGTECWQYVLKEKEADFAYSLPGVGRSRVNVYMQQRGPDIVFRLLPFNPPSLESLGLPETLIPLTHYRTGIVLCTGPTGCGKSSTLAALLDLVVKSRCEHIITIEDPIEFIFESSKGLVNQRQIGNHTQSFARALRAALREDPDVIGITELRDPETIGLALSAAETGHLVFGSLHTGSASQTISRIINAFSADQQAQVRVMLSESLKAVVSQRLVNRADRQGRVVALEVLVVTPAVANLIREDKTFQLPSVMQMGRAQGMMLLDDSLQQLVRANIISGQEASRFAVDPRRFS